MAEMNVELFKKRVKLFDSDKDGERNEAIRQALLQTSSNGLLFAEACELAFGGRGDSGQVQQLEAEVARLNSELGEIANAYNSYQAPSGGWPSTSELDASTMATMALA